MQHLNQAYRNKKVLITGGAGFIGSHLAEKCYEMGAHVTILDNLSTGSLANLSHIQHNITFIEGDVRNQEICRRAVTGIDTVFHLAAVTSVPESFEKYAYYYNTNIDGTLQILSTASEAMVQRFIFASSAAVYGNYEGTCSETAPCNPVSPYGFSKYIGEQLCHYFAQFHHISAACLRYFNVYGPRQRGDLPHAGVIAHFMYCLEHHRPFTLYGTGDQQRDFVSVHEVVHANLMFGAYLPHTSYGETYNIGSGRTTTLRDMINKLRSAFPHYPEPHIRYAPARHGDIHCSAADCSKYDYFKQSVQNLS